MSIPLQSRATGVAGSRAGYELHGAWRRLPGAPLPVGPGTDLPVGL